MTRVLVTGGNGALGREVVTQLAAHYTVRVMSRRATPASLQTNIEWVQADLETGQGIDGAVCDVDVIVHAASSPFKHTRRIDVDGTRLLLEQASAAGVTHIVYISIVGIDRIPYYYYRAKLAAEEIITGSGIPWSVLRATQFHSLLDRTLQAASKLPLVMPLPTDLRGQPVADGEVAARLCELVVAGPSGRVPDMAGPEILTMGEIAKIWLARRALRRMLIHFPLPGKTTESFRRGYNTCPDCPEETRGKITWTEWVRKKYRG